MSSRPERQPSHSKEQALHDAVEKLSSDIGTDDALLTSGAVRLRALKSLGKGVGLCLAGGVVVGVMVWLGISGESSLASLLMVPTLFVGAAYLVAGLTGLLTGRPWVRTPFWVKLPMMIVGAFLALVAIFAVGVFGNQVVRGTEAPRDSASERESTPAPDLDMGALEDELKSTPGVQMTEGE
jgi:hypothetical protein